MGLRPEVKILLQSLKHLIPASPFQQVIIQDSNTNTTGTIPITITGDNDGEQDETFEVEISASSDVTTGTSEKSNWYNH